MTLDATLLSFAPRKLIKLKKVEILSEFLSLVPSWIPMVPAIIVGFLVYYLPGIIFAILIGQKGLSVIALAPAISTSLFFSLAIIYFYAGINLNLITLTIGLVAILSLTFALASLLKVQSPKFPDFFNKSSMRNLFILIPILLIVCMAIFHLGTPGLYYRFSWSDLAHHNSYIRYLAEYQGLRVFPGYQRGMHVVGYLICSIAQIVPNQAVDIIIIISSVSLIVGMVYLSRIFFNKIQSIFIGGTIGVIYAGLFICDGLNHLVPLHVAISMIPGLLGIVVKYCQNLQFNAKYIFNSESLIILVAGLGILFTHYNAGAASVLITCFILSSVKSVPKYVTIPILTISISIYITLSFITITAENSFRPIVVSNFNDAFEFFFLNNTVYFLFLVPVNFLIIFIFGLIQSVANHKYWIAFCAMPFFLLQLLDICTGQTNSFWDNLDRIFNSTTFHQPERLTHIYLITIIPAILYGIERLGNFLYHIRPGRLVQVVAVTIMLPLLVLGVNKFIATSNGAVTPNTWDASSRKLYGTGLLYSDRQNNFLTEVKKNINAGAYIRRDNGSDHFNLFAQYGYKSVWNFGYNLPFHWTNWDLDEFKNYCQRIDIEPEFKTYLWVTEPYFRPSAYHKSVWSMGNKTIVSDGTNKLYDFNCEFFGY
jgi:hypothetical protein